MKKLIPLLALFLIASCSRPLVVSQAGYQERKMSDSLRVYDQHMETIVKPYRDSMEAEMKQVLAVSDTILSKQMPESDLGNLLADILLDKAQQYTHRKVDVAVINFGGIRISQLPKGNITRGHVFELMPFDNELVLLEVDGATLKKLFDRMAASGGVPVAGASYAIRSDKTCTNIMVQGAAIDMNRKYTLAISDYLANGGDKLDMLKPITQFRTNKLLRDAFMEGFIDMNAKGQHVKSIRDGRVKLISK